ncbi:MAG: hypothetical protein EOP05_19430, partial [Proteobacteria bacterium]
VLLLVPLVAFNNCAPAGSANLSSQSSSSSEDSAGDGSGSGGGGSGPGSSVPAGKTQVEGATGCLETGSGALAGAVCDASNSNQVFSLLTHTDGSVSLRDASKNECIEASAELLSAGTNLKSAACATSALQNFTLLHVSMNAFRLISQVNGACLSLGSNRSANLTVCNSSNSQAFKLAANAVAGFKFSSSLEKPLAVGAGKPVGNNFKGMHLGGGESGNLTDQNKYGYTFAYPSNTLIDYVARKGFGLIRLSFKAGRLQPDRNGALDPVELARIDKVVQYAHSKGLYVLLDPHDYGSLPDADKSGKKIGSADMPASKFANFWAHVAAAYINQPNVLFGLINEPFGINARTWQSSAIAAVSAIRSVGAKQKIFIPGVSWTGAHSWVSSGNAAVWANFHETNSVFE